MINKIVYDENTEQLITAVNSSNSLSEVGNKLGISRQAIYGRIKVRPNDKRLVFKNGKKLYKEI